MSTTTRPSPTANTSSSNSGRKPALHMFCRFCYPNPKPGNAALCGYLAQGGGPAFIGLPPAEWPLCVVCEDLVKSGCPKCGQGR